MAENGSTLAKIVPEFFYDLIARILPGLVFAVLLLIAAAPESLLFFRDLAVQNKLEGVPFALLFLVLIAIAYILGILLGPLGARVRDLYLPRVWKACAGTAHEAFVVGYATRRGLIGTAVENPAVASLDRKALKTLYRLLEDELKAKDPLGRVLLPKLHAETVLCDHLCAASLLVAALAGVLTLTGTRQPRTAWTVFVLFLFALAIFTGWTAKYRFWGLIQRLLSLSIQIRP